MPQVILPMRDKNAMPAMKIPYMKVKPLAAGSVTFRLSDSTGPPLLPSGSPLLPGNSIADSSPALLLRIDPPPMDGSLQMLIKESLKASEHSNNVATVDGEPDKADVAKIVDDFKDLGVDGYKVQLAKMQIKLDHALSKNHLLLEGLRVYMTKTQAFMHALRT
ncbi:uncharacterized protein ARMOST_16493 [Armillaria ostoyae]|uniref:Uncharacterized protein n=1 Tax=Armillaria ostoyae TaxID=47428 RepID=A0A284RWC3_ARMOS|nr:uncharacterized protein ARMOST_16493 [Armillaria ostoyae]